MVSEVNHSADVDKAQVAHQVAALVEDTRGIVFVVDQRRLETPRVVIVPATHEQARHAIGHITLAKHGDGLTRLVLLQRLDGPGPESRGYRIAADVVTTEAVDVGLIDPIFHRLDHGHLGGLLAVVQLIDVAIAVGAGERRVIVVTMLRDPHVVLCSMVSDPVKPHLHAALMGSIDEIPEVVNCTEVAVHSMVVTRSIGTAE